jgi:hypothetical protein
MMNLSGIENQLQAISSAVNQIASDRTHWITDVLLCRSGFLGPLWT